MISGDFAKCERAETKCQSWESRTDGGARCVLARLFVGSAAGVNVRGEEECPAPTLHINPIYQAHWRMRHEIRLSLQRTAAVASYGGNITLLQLHGCN